MYIAGMTNEDFIQVAVRQAVSEVEAIFDEKRKQFAEERKQFAAERKQLNDEITELLGTITRLREEHATIVNDLQQQIQHLRRSVLRQLINERANINNLRSLSLCN